MCLQSAQFAIERSIQTIQITILPPQVLFESKAFKLLMKFMMVFKLILFDFYINIGAEVLTSILINFPDRG